MSGEEETESQSFVAGNLYLLLAGVVIGILFGPLVLGRFQPDTYASIFPSEQRAWMLLSEYDQETAILRHRTSSTGVSPEALTELEAQRAIERQNLMDDVDRARRSVARLHAVALALLAVLAAEVVSGRRTALITARYGIGSIWIALLLAQPHLLKEVSLPFAFAIGVMAIVCGIPFGMPKRKSDG